MIKEIFLSILVAVISYLIGSVSTGILLSKNTGTDIRSEGSRNPGATNMLRVMGTKMGVLTFIGDSLKAIIACLLGQWVLPNNTFGIEGFGTMLAGIFAVLGHNWPIFYDFRGGKGVASSVAVRLMLNPTYGLFCLGIFLLIIYFTEYISLGSLCLISCFVLLCLLEREKNLWMIICSLLLFALSLYRHRANISRLLHGTENKMTFFRKRGKQ